MSRVPNFTWTDCNKKNFKLFINLLFQNDWGRRCVNKLFRKQILLLIVRDFFVHFETPFGVCNGARLFSALFGHAVANEYANVRTGMLTVYYVRTAQSLPSQTISHMLPAAQAVSTDNTPHTHPPQTT